MLSLVKLLKIKDIVFFIIYIEIPKMEEPIFQNLHFIMLLLYY